MSLPHRRQWYRNNRQHALLEYASLKYLCPEGIYISLKPGSPSQWSGILFVRKGPYAPAVLRFDISFPSRYPILPPSITFVSDIFHPLVTPLTTYTYSTGSLSSETVSATDEERLPPGGFSLSHGFPHWFGRAEKSAPSSSASSRNVSGSQYSHECNNEQGGLGRSTTITSNLRLASQRQPSPSVASSISTFQHPKNGPLGIGIVAVLWYMKEAFNDEATMETLPLEAAGNPGAWNAWRAHRKSLNTVSNLSAPEVTSGNASDFDPDNSQGRATPNKGKLPSDWNWDGVWQERVRKGIDASISNSVLYGALGGGNDLIDFVDADNDLIKGIKDYVFANTSIAE